MDDETTRRIKYIYWLQHLTWYALCAALILGFGLTYHAIFETSTDLHREIIRLETLICEQNR